MAVAEPIPAQQPGLWHNQHGDRVLVRTPGTQQGEEYLGRGTRSSGTGGQAPPAPRGSAKCPSNARSTSAR